jgi:hypothetical protein
MEELAKVKIMWQRLTEGEWVPVKRDDVCRVTCNDIEKRNWGVSVKGITTIAPNIIEGTPDVMAYVKAQVKVKGLTFTGNSKIGNVAQNVAVGETGITMSNKNGNKKNREMELCTDPATRFVLVPTRLESRLEPLVGKDTIRGLVYPVARSGTYC